MPVILNVLSSFVLPPCTALPQYRLFPFFFPSLLNGAPERLLMNFAASEQTHINTRVQLADACGASDGLPGNVRVRNSDPQKSSSENKGGGWKKTRANHARSIGRRGRRETAIQHGVKQQTLLALPEPSRENVTRTTRAVPRSPSRSP